MQESLPLILDSGGGGGAKIARASVIDMPTALGNINDLSQSLTIGGTAFAPCAYLVADDINPTTGAWASRHDASKVLSVAGAGTAPTYGNATAITNNAVKYAAAKYHQAADTTWGQLSTGDFAAELVFLSDISTAGGKMVFSTYVAGTGTGVAAYVNPSALVILIYIGAVNKCTVQVTIAHDTYYHAFWGVDASQNLYAYINGTYINTGAVTAYGGSLSSGALTLGAHSSGGNSGASGILSFGLWDLPANPWPGAATNQAVMGAIAAERFAKVAGIYDRKSTVYSFARTTAAYLDRYVSAGVRQLFPVSVNWPRVQSRKGDAGVTDTGYLSEIQRKNELLYSEDLSNAAWAKTRATVGSNSAVAPDGTTTADSIIGDATANTHYVGQAIPSEVASHIFSVFLKSGNKTWAKLAPSNPAQTWAYFDLGNGVVGSKGAGIGSHGIQNWGNGWYRCWVDYEGGVASHSHDIYPADADGDENYTGDATTADLYAWGMQHEENGILLPTSYIKTLAAVVTRTKDALVRTVAVTTGKLSTSCDVYLGHTHDATNQKTLIAIDDGTTNNVISHNVSTSDVTVLGVTTGGSAVAAITGATSLNDGNWHGVTTKVKTNYAAQTVDGTVDGTPDTALTTAASYTAVRIGCSGTGLTQQPTGLISKIKVFKDVL